MLQYLVQIDAPDGVSHSFTLSREDIGILRNAPVGRPVSLENYIGYLTADRQLALSRRPSHVETAIVSHAELCRKLDESGNLAD